MLGVTSMWGATPVGVTPSPPWGSQSHRGSHSRGRSHSRGMGESLPWHGGVLPVAWEILVGEITPFGGVTPLGEVTPMGKATPEREFIP